MHNTTKEKYAHYRVKQVRNKSVLNQQHIFFLVILLVVAIDAQGISQRPFDGKHSPTRTQADGHTDFSWDSAQKRASPWWSDICKLKTWTIKLTKQSVVFVVIGQSPPEKICPFRFRLMHQIGRMIQSFFLRSYFDHSTAHLNSSGTFMTHSRDLHVVFASTQPTATPLSRTCADSKTECTFYSR